VYGFLLKCTFLKEISVSQNEASFDKFVDFLCFNVITETRKREAVNPLRFHFWRKILEMLKNSWRSVFLSKLKKSARFFSPMLQKAWFLSIHFSDGPLLFFIYLFNFGKICFTFLPMKVSLRVFANLVRCHQGDQMSLWEKCPKGSPAHFCLNYYVTCTAEKSIPKTWATSVIFEKNCPK
jgi:hypothetical protein